jgi:hypothetical protein
MKPRIAPDILDVFEQMKAATVEYPADALAERRVTFSLEARLAAIEHALPDCPTLEMFNNLLEEMAEIKTLLEKE